MSEFLGTGLKFPIRPNGRGGLSYVSGERSVAEAIWIILSTPKKSRIMQPAFGCGIHDYVFAPNNANTSAVIETEVRATLSRWERRVDVLSVTATAHLDAPNTLLIEVDYRIRANNAAGNLVYPFFINEGLA